MTQPKWPVPKLALRLATLLGVRTNEELASITHMATNFRAMELNLKAFGYDLGRRLAEALPVPETTAAYHVGLVSKGCTQADIESPWLAHWARQIRSAVLYHRKLWEHAYILQAIYEHGHMRPGARGVGFGCGEEPIPSALAAQGVAVTVTDLNPDEARARGWLDSNQHSSSLDSVHYADIIDRPAFDSLVTHRTADMNAIPADLTDYDFCWSTCAFEHLGTIRHGLDFVRASLGTIRPGGLSVHTTEFNIDSNRQTIESGETVLFQRKHMEALAERLRSEGHDVAPFDFDFGEKPMDQFIDIPPFGDDSRDEIAASMRHPRHLKLSVCGHVSTSFGIIVRKAG